MRKYVYTVVIFLSAFIFNACSGGDNSGLISNPSIKKASVVLVDAEKIITDLKGENFTLRLHLMKNENENFLVELDNFDLRIDGCNIDTSSLRFDPSSLTLDGNALSREYTLASGVFTTTCLDAKDKKYVFSADMSITINGKTEKSKFIASSVEASGEGGNLPTTEGYSFFNATTTDISQANTPYTIKVQLLKDGYAVSGKTIKMKAFSSTYGTVSVAEVLTGADGFANFDYTSPAVLPTNGTTTELQLDFQDDSNQTITQYILLTFNAIGGGTDTNVSIPVVVIANSYKNITLTSNSQNIQMEIQVFDESTNTPYTTGNVKVSLPDSVLTGTNVGSFTEYVVPVSTNGRALFNYTGPQDLQSLVNAGETGASFAFYHEENSGNREGVTVTYDLSSSYIPANYILTTSSADGNQTMGLQTMKTFTLYLKDDQGTLTDDADITQIVIESKNTLIGKLVDTANGGVNVPLITLNGTDASNSMSFPIQTDTLSGLLPIEITVTFKDANSVSQTLIINMNIVVFSGPPTAMSISYAGVEQNSTTAKYIEKFTISVTDAYNNPVNSRPYLAVGSMVEYAVDGSSATGTRTTISPRLWHGTIDSRGVLESTAGNKAQFTTTINTFNYVDINNDKLVVFGAGFVYEALGKWDIDTVANQLLGLKDDYFGTTRLDLGFAVGHNNRQDLCSVDQREYVGNMKANNYQLSDAGHALIEFEYDYHLTGKDIMVWANLTGFQADNNNTGRIGEAKKHTLRGNGLVSPETWTLIGGSTAVSLPFSVEHENAPERYKNGHFGFSVTGNCIVHGILDWSNRHDARECTNKVGYVDLNVSNPGAEDCTISIDSINVSSEFSGVSVF